MSTESFTKSNLDTILKELAKEYKKLGGKNVPAEIILIGGAAVIGNYGFREMTTDIDAVIEAASIMKDAINRVGDKLNLPNGWLNDDFRKTSSYSSKLSEVSLHYKSFYGVLDVRTVSAEYLIAMKLRAGRQYKNDLSDIIGILAAHKTAGNEITMERIDRAVRTLYGTWDDFPPVSISFINGILENGNYEAVYEQVRDNEKLAKEMLVEFKGEYPGVAKTDNIDSILSGLRKKSESKQ